MMTGSPGDKPPPPFEPTYAYQRVESPRTILDDEHLRLLRIGYFISAAQTAFLIPFGLMYAATGFFAAAVTPGSSGAGSWMTWVFGIFGGAIAALATVAAVLKLLAAIRLKERRSRGLCMVAAGITCLEVPYGTALGVMTFVVLSRPSVRQLFEQHR